MPLVILIEDKAPLFHLFIGDITEPDSGEAVLLKDPGDL
jgi:hypothetical protein